MNAVILAAGRGSRMKDLTEKRPKCFVPFAGKPLLQWQLAALRSAGIQRIALVRGYLAEYFTEDDITYFTNNDWASTNMVASLMCASPWLERNTSVISYSDIIYTADIVTTLCNTPGDIVITYDVEWLQQWQVRFSNPLDDAETFHVDEKGQLLDIGKKPSDIAEVNGQYMGLLKISIHGWKTIANFLSGLSLEEVKRMDITTLLSSLLMKGVRIDTAPISGGWFEMDSESDLAACQAFFGPSGPFTGRH